MIWSWLLLYNTQEATTVVEASEGEDWFSFEDDDWRIAMTWMEEKDGVVGGTDGIEEDYGIVLEASVHAFFRSFRLQREFQKKKRNECNGVRTLIANLTIWKFFP